MKKRTALLQVADVGPLESLVLMLRSVGYTCVLPNPQCLSELRGQGLDTVLSVHDLIRSGSYDPVRPPIGPLEEVGPEALRTCALYVDVKAHRNGPKLWKRYPRLADRTLWYRINGCQPEHVINARGDHGNEINPPCPVLTPNLWYGSKYWCPDCKWVEPTSQLLVSDRKCVNTGCRKELQITPWYDKAYACWPPFVRFSEYYVSYGRASTGYDPPLCLVHNLQGWGYGALVEPFREQFNLRCYGGGNPDGDLAHSEVPKRLAKALCMIHLKSSDSPGYALYEAMAAACPLIVTRRLIWRNRMEDMLVPGETCLVFDRETHEGLSAQDVAECIREVKDNLIALRDLSINRRIGLAAKDRLKSLMWTADNDEHVASLSRFLYNNFEDHRE